MQSNVPTQKVLAHYFWWHCRAKLTVQQQRESFRVKLHVMQCAAAVLLFIKKYFWSVSLYFQLPDSFFLFLPFFFSLTVKFFSCILLCSLSYFATMVEVMSTVLKLFLFYYSGVYACQNHVNRRLLPEFLLNSVKRCKMLTQCQVRTQT